MDVYGFPHQVGGHFGLLNCSGHVLKPWNQREFEFYSQMDERLLPFTAKVCGCVKVNCTSKEELVIMNTDKIVQCHSNLQTSQEREKTCRKFAIKFRLRNGRIEADPILNSWAGQCQYCTKNLQRR